MTDIVVTVLAWIGALNVLCLAGFTPIILLGWWHDRHPRPPATTPMPDRYTRARTDLLERAVVLDATRVLDNEWTRSLVAEAETLCREAAP